MAQKIPFKGLHTCDRKSSSRARQNCRLIQIGSHLVQVPAPSRTTYNSWSSPLSTLHWTHSSRSVSLVLVWQNRDTALQGRFQKCWTEGKNHLTCWLSSCSPRCAWSPSFTKWTCPVQINLNPPWPSSHILQSCSQPNSPQSELVHSHYCSIPDTAFSTWLCGTSFRSSQSSLTRSHWLEVPLSSVPVLGGLFIPSYEEKEAYKF